MHLELIKTCSPCLMVIGFSLGYKMKYFQAILIHRMIFLKNQNMGEKYEGWWIENQEVMEGVVIRITNHLGFLL